ncbi:MAG: DUF3808 domain-containing protein, partial [Candidatus Schekmanbacteria bacterium]|nr:DUF3808 domain-containing protein [Candidatus Schekmanbacteria bacterium]
RPALKQFQQLIVDFPQSSSVAESLYYIGISYTNLKKDLEAQEAFQSLRKRFPDSALVFNAYLEEGHILRRQKKYGAALEQYKQIISSSSEDLIVEAQYWIGECHLLADQYEQAVSEYMRVAYLYPDKQPWADKALLGAGMAYAKWGKTADAVKLLEKVKKSPDPELSKQAENQLESLKKQ